MFNKTLLALACAAVVSVSLPVGVAAQSDLDAFMERVLARRDDNWKKLQQYVLDEREAFDLTGPGGLPLWGMRRDYTWFIRQGVFVRSPLKANGVTVSEADRRKAEDEWLKREKSREERRKRRAEKAAANEPLAPGDRGSITVGPQGIDVDMVDVLKQGGEPQFVSSSYFLKFRFEKGHYALAGREAIDGVQALKIEYYPEAGLFNDGRERPNKKVRDEDDKIEEKMNKVSLVTIWVDPKSYQILQYTFDDIDMDFFPGRALARIDDLKATMRMAQQFPNIWLPKNIDMKFEMTLAVGTVDASYRVDYHDYKEAAVTYKIKLIKSAFIVLLLACGASAALHAQEPASGPGLVGEVRVHGNHTTPDADVLAIVGDVVGQPATDTLLADIASRLKKSGRFDGVDVRKRYQSIDNPDDILLMIVVDEVPGVSDLDLTPGPWKRFKSTGMFLPVLHYDDGYGFTYGARVSFVNLLGKGSRISMPFTWGGERQARVQLERGFGPGRLFGDAGVGRKEIQHYEIGDTRTGAHARAEGAIQKWFRVGGGGGVEDVRFGEVRDRLTRGGVDVTLDTRVDPAYPRNAVHATFGVEHLSFDAGHANRKTTDLRGYIGLIGQTVLSVRGLSIASSEPVPAYEQSLLGGDSTLRGYETGYQANDNLVAVSAELRVPITSPLSVGRFGIKIFTDAGAAYAAGAKMADQKLESGYGGGVYLHLTILSLEFDVARSEAGDTKFHFGMGVAFR